LENIRCPNCGNSDKFFVEATITAEITDDGAEPAAYGGYEYDEKAHASCPDCSFAGPWREFWLNRPYRYKIETTFDADRELTQQEIDSLIACVETQVQEPVVLDSVDGDWDTAEWDSSNVAAVVTPLL
jgi:hypothetical protein